VLAVESGFRGYFTNAEEMVANIAQAGREGNLASKLKTYTAPSVLVIDLCRHRVYADGGARGR
jgi:DNA replication protein DnaC